MQALGKYADLTTAQADAAWAEPLALKPLKQVYNSQYPHFIQYARSEVEQMEVGVADIAAGNRSGESASTSIPADACTRNMRKSRTGAGCN